MEIKTSDIKKILVNDYGYDLHSDYWNDDLMCILNDVISATKNNYSSLLQEVEQLKKDKRQLEEKKADLIEYGLQVSKECMRFKEFVDLAANSYKLVNDKTSESDVWRLLQCKASDIINRHSKQD